MPTSCQASKTQTGRLNFKEIVKSPLDNLDI